MQRQTWGRGFRPPLRGRPHHESEERREQEDPYSHSHYEPWMRGGQQHHHRPYNDSRSSMYQRQPNHPSPYYESHGRQHSFSPYFEARAEPRQQNYRPSFNSHESRMQRGRHSNFVNPSIHPYPVRQSGPSQMRGQQERTETSSRGHHRGAGRGQVGGTPEGIRPPYYIGYKRLHEIATKLSPLEAVMAVMDPNESFRRLLSNPETFQKCDWVVLIVGVFEKVCCVDGCENMVNAALTMLNQSEFLEVCSSRVLLEFQCNPSKTEVGCQLLQQFFLILKAFATKYPGVSGSNVMKAIHACNNYVLFLKTQEFDVEALEGKFAELLTTVQDASKAFQGSSVSPYAMKSMAEEERLNRLHLETAPNNFREIPIIPTSEEILNAEAPFLRSNITKGAYMNVEHYLDVQFRLLREDFVAPLRNGLKEYLLGGMGRKNFRHQDIRVYTGVTFHHMDHDFYGIHLIFKFDVSRFSRVKWDITKRFMTGSLLCFADLDFNYLTFGTVSRRNADELKKGFLTISPQSDMFNLDAWMQGEKIIIEASSAYFEAYRHVLRCLQQRDEESFPLTDYIVYGAMKDAPPKFLPDYYDFSFIRTHLDTVDLLAKAYWPPAGDFGLDESQLQAFQSALTQEFSVIQGPPGSGKTYIGLKVVETLLKNNVTEQTGPILVICFTNHALDQFLEGILSFTKKIVRIGGRSKSPHMEAYHIRKWEEKTRQMKSSFDDIVLAKMRRQHICEMNTVKGHVKYYQEKLSLLQEGLGLVSPQTMKDMGIMDEETHRVIPKFFDWLNEFGGEANFQRECRLVQDGIQRELIKLKSAVPLEKPVQKPEPRQQQEEADDDDDEEDEIEDAQAFRLAQFVDDDEFDPIVDVEDNKPIQVTDAFVKLDFEMFTENLRLKIQHAESKLEDFVNVEDPSPQEVAMMAAAEKQYTRARKELEFFEQIQPLLMVNPLKIPPKPKILQEGDLDEQTLLQLSLYECLELVAFWHGQVFAWIRDELMKKSRSYLELVDKLREVQGVTQLHAMKGAEVIGMTTSGAAKYQALLQNIGNKIVIVEEAAEVMEAHIVTSLSRSCQQLILIGDHQQLRPNPTVYELARKYHLDVSMFERAVNNGIQVKRLRIQHRMRPAISCLITPHIYPDLINHDSVLDYPSISGMSENLFFLTHAYKEAEEEDLRSHKNLFEAEFVLALCQRLLRQDTYTTEDITILTTYSGQLLAFKQLLKGNQYEDCKGVRCTVVDNFQGEENKIILLSLVRSNEEAKIGFLKTENRVCVALSRAKWGLYIVGNMDSLCSGSEIWKKMLEALEKQEAIGTELELQCSIHRDQIISASQPSHFPAGGGCHLQCKVKMPCGHVCPKACHAYDREHKSLRCNESCLNKCPAGTHDCAKRCWENCNPCRIPIVKTIPACRHSNEMPCHLDPDKAQCQIPCVARLECGHQCARKCHVLDDPEHIKYDCQKPCERMCNEEHKCKAKCGKYPCPPCMVVMDRILPCGHEEKLPCHYNVNAYKCLQNCTKTLPCGHRCRLKCSYTCGQCRKRVKKPIPGCGHMLEVECWSIPKKEDCTQTCERRLICGHSCTNLCRDICTEKCKVLVPYRGDSSSICGHGANVPCCDSRKMLDPEELMELCEAPCSKVLPGCEHVCMGKCGGCWGGRLHQECNHKCGRPLVCGHVCPLKCSRSCPPCNKKCQNKCKHSRCTKKCGDPCPPCQEPCTWQCDKGCPKKLKCTKKCHEICNREPCDQPCPKKIKKCDHPCIGLCGEPCPPQCKICNAEELAEFQIYGNEADEDARFVYLPDCGHCIEVEAMDHHMKMEMEEIGMKKCPRCHTVIWSSVRYGNVIRQLYRNVAAVKEKAFGDPKKNQDDFLKSSQDLLRLSASSLHLQTEFTVLKGSAEVKVERIKKFRNTPHTPTIVDQFELLTFKHQVEFLEKLDLSVKQEGLSPNVQARLARRAKAFASRVLSRTRGFNDWELKSLAGEVVRLRLMGEYWKLQELGVEKHPRAKQHFQRAETLLLGLESFTEEMNQEAHKELDAASKSCGGLGISNEERIMILKAMNLGQGHWYKCPNGHIYAIGDCGGANQTSQCNECRAVIGGERHRLIADNAHASEMDGSRFPAWSEMNNLQNFDPRQVL